MSALYILLHRTSSKVIRKLKGNFRHSKVVNFLQPSTPPILQSLLLFSIFETCFLRPMNILTFDGHASKSSCAHATAAVFAVLTCARLTPLHHSELSTNLGIHRKEQKLKVKSSSQRTLLKVVSCSLCEVQKGRAWSNYG